MQKIVIVDEQDNQVRLEDKVVCHVGDGILHRAFSVFIFNNKRELLIQQRSKEKLLWPLFWANTCCSHPSEGEDYQTAGQRRLQEELGFSCPLKLIGKFQYHAHYKDVGAEHELCSVLVGKYDGQVNASPEEVAATTWVNFEELKRELALNPRQYAPWFVLELEQFFVEGFKNYA